MSSPNSRMWVLLRPSCNIHSTTRAAPGCISVMPSRSHQASLRDELTSLRGALRFLVGQRAEASIPLCLRAGPARDRFMPALNVAHAVGKLEPAEIYANIDRDLRGN